MMFCQKILQNIPVPRRLGVARYRAVIGALTLSLAALSVMTSAQAEQECLADPSWISAPNPPQEIPGINQVGGPTFCQFYQFGWQWFLYLVSPSKVPGDRNFQVWEDFPILQAGKLDSCNTQPSGHSLKIRTIKAAEADAEFVIPERIHEAGDDATIYDQNHNVVYFDVRFSRNMCGAPATGNLPAGSTEIKTSWRQIDRSQAADYFAMEAVITGVSEDPILLGLVGFHLMRTTEVHAEGVWLTFEHADNAPYCLNPQDSRRQGWSFTSPACAKCLKDFTNDVQKGTSRNIRLVDLMFGGCLCNFNIAGKLSSLTAPPTEICRVYRDGTRIHPDVTHPIDPHAKTNIAAIDSLNERLVGPDGLLAKAAVYRMRIWKNYFNVGGIWVSEPKLPATRENQRGSLQLTNSTLETTYQGKFKSDGVTRTDARNCFACHNYQPGQTADPNFGLSHIFSNIHGG